MTMTINRCSINDLASYDPGLEFSQATASLSASAASQSSFKIADKKVDPWLGFLMQNPETFVPTAFRAPEIVKPVSPGLVAESLIFLGWVAVGIAAGGMIVGPAALLKSPEPPALDFRLSLLR